MQGIMHCTKIHPATLTQCDLHIICSDAPLSRTDVDGYQPKIIFVDGKNHITGLKQ